MPFILFAEDDSDDAELLRVACDRVGLAPKSYYIARDGLQALTYLDSADAKRHAAIRPSLVITDLKMQLMDGLQLLSWIRQSPEYSNLPVMIMTNYVSIQHEARARSLGCTKFLSKPPRLDELISVIRELCLVS